MRGVLLRSGKSEDFTALGETGQPVYRAALQLREAIRRKYPEHPHLVEHLAIPQPDALGSTLDWYSERPGDVILAEVSRQALSREESMSTREGTAADDDQSLVPVEPIMVPVGQAQLKQIPDLEGAIVALDPHTGRVLAMMGGYSFFKSPFNRVTQARRQPGSSFKPFVYGAALESGYTPSVRILDSPYVYYDENTGEVWGFLC